jgi:hypothetical protein
LQSQLVNQVLCLLQVLLDFVAHQELILSLLYEDKAPPAAHAAAGLKAQVLGQAALRESRGESVQQQATRPFSLDAASGSTLVSSPAPAMNMLQHLQATAASRLSIQPPSNGSYVGALLQRATQEQVQRALQMTAADWSAFFQQSFAKLVVLLELCRRNDYTSGTSQPPSTATSAEAGAGSLFGQPSANSVTATVAAATAAIPSLTPGCNWQQVSWIVDEWVTLTAAALLLNPIPIYMATTINHGTQQQDAPPAGYWQSVVQRLKLTGWQVLHFHLALQELARLDKMTLAHNKSLAADAGCLSTLVQAAHAELHTDDDGDTAAAATGSTDIEPAAAAAAAAGTQHAALVGDGQEAQQGDSAVQQQQQQHGQACEVPSAAAKDSSTPDPNISSDSQSKQQQQEEQREGGAQQDPGTGLHVKAEDMLQRKVQKLPLQGQLMMAFNCNTLTKMQLAQVLVSCRPDLDRWTFIAVMPGCNIPCGGLIVCPCCNAHGLANPCWTGHVINPPRTSGHCQHVLLMLLLLTRFSMAVLG